MSFVQNPIPTFSQAAMLTMLPPADGLYFFYNTDHNGELYSVDSNGVFTEATDAECCACEISGTWMDGLTCSLKKGTITAAEYQAAISQGIVVSATETTGSCVVSISTPFQPVISVTVSPSTISSLAVSATAQITPTVLPANADQRVLWVSSDITKVSVSQSGLARGVATGTATITCYSVSDPTKSSTCVVTVP